MDIEGIRKKEKIIRSIYSVIERIAKC